MLKKEIIVRGKKLTVISIVVDGSAYERCIQSSNNMWASNKPGQWGRGMGNTEYDPRKVERAGRLGETALGKLINQEPDYEYREYGDEEDFILNEKKLEMKISFKRPTYDAGLVRAVTDNGNKLSLTSDIYVFGYMEEDDSVNKTAIIALVGYITRENMINRPLKKAYKGGHLNYEVPFDELIPISEL